MYEVTFHVQALYLTSKLFLPINKSIIGIIGIFKILAKAFEINFYVLAIIAELFILIFYLDLVAWIKSGWSVNCPPNYRYLSLSRSGLLDSL